MENQEIITKWNALTDMQKRAFGDRFISHESNLYAWSKLFEDLSEDKKKKVLRALPDTSPETLNYVIS